MCPCMLVCVWDGEWGVGGWRVGGGCEREVGRGTEREKEREGRKERKRQREEGAIYVRWSKRERE